MPESRILHPLRIPKTLFAGVGAMAALFLLAPESRAEDQPSASEQARVLLMKGNVALRKGDEVMARHHYQKSFELEASFDAVCNLGGVEARSKMYVEAYEHLQLCLQMYPDDPDLAETRGKIEESKNGVLAEISPEEAREADIRVVEFMKRRDEAAQEEAAEETSASSAEELPESSAPPPSTSEPRSTARVPVSVGLGIAGLAGIGVGVGFQLKAAGHQKEADTLRAEVVDDDGTCSGEDAHPACGDLTDQLDGAKSSRLIRTVGFAAGGAFLVGSVLTYVLWPEPKTATSARFTPVLVTDREGFSLGLHGTF